MGRAIVIYFYKEICRARSPLLYEKLNKIHRGDPTWKIDLLWKFVWPLRSPRPGWSGMMQAVHQDTHPGKTLIKKLEQRVDKLEEAADNTEQYSRRPNLRVHGIPDASRREYGPANF